LEDLAQVNAGIQNTDLKLEPGINVYDVVMKIIQKAKNEEGKYEFNRIVGEELDIVKSYYSSLSWLSQISFRLHHEDFKDLVYPQLKDEDGYRFTKKQVNHFKKTTTVYYYCEGYTACDVSIKINFQPGTFNFMEVHLF